MIKYSVRLALLSLAPFSLADISQCPSSECWTFDATDGCVLKGSTDCGYAVACSTDGMTVTVRLLLKFLFSRHEMGIKNSDFGLWLKTQKLENS